VPLEHAVPMATIRHIVATPIIIRPLNVLKGGFYQLCGDAAELGGSLGYFGVSQCLNGAAGGDGAGNGSSRRFSEGEGEDLAGDVGRRSEGSEDLKWEIGGTCSAKSSKIARRASVDERSV